MVKTKNKNKPKQNKTKQKKNRKQCFTTVYKISMWNPIYKRYRA